MMVDGLCKLPKLESMNVPISRVKDDHQLFMVEQLGRLEKCRKLDLLDISPNLVQAWSFLIEKLKVEELCTGDMTEEGLKELIRVCPDLKGLEFFLPEQQNAFHQQTMDGLNAIQNVQLRYMGHGKVPRWLSELTTLTMLHMCHGEIDDFAVLLPLIQLKNLKADVRSSEQLATKAFGEIVSRLEILYLNGDDTELTELPRGFIGRPVNLARLNLNGFIINGAYFLEFKHYFDILRFDDCVFISDLSFLKDLSFYSLVVNRCFDLNVDIIPREAFANAAGDKILLFLN